MPTNPVQKKAVGCLIIFLALFLGLIITVANIMPNCGPESPKAKFIRNLSQDRLALLHQQMTDLADSVTDDSSLILMRDEDIPPEFKDLGCQSIRPLGAGPYIVLEHCLNHGLLLKFKGVSPQDRKEDIDPAIILQAGEFEPSIEQLWPTK